MTDAIAANLYSEFGNEECHTMCVHSFADRIGAFQNWLLWRYPQRQDLADVRGTVDACFANDLPVIRAAIREVYG